MPASVISVAVADGQQVRRGDVIVVLEAMKMQHTITAPTDGMSAGLVTWLQNFGSTSMPKPPLPTSR